MSNTNSKLKSKTSKGTNNYGRNRKKRGTNNRNAGGDYSNQSQQMNDAYDTNDVAWYSRYPELLKASASITYALPNGTGVPCLDNNSFPGLVCNRVTMCCPYTTDHTDPVNVSGVNTFIFIRKGKSGNASYDPTDLTKLLFAASHIYSFITWLQRIYGLATLYSTQNKYLPTAIFNAENIDIDNITVNMANFRYGINQLIHKVGALCIPNQSMIPLFSRYAFMFSNLYIGSSTIKDQMYMNTPTGFYKYNLALSKLTFKRLSTKGKMTYDYLLKYGNYLIGDMYGDTDVANMCADILNAYGEGNLIKLSLLAEDYRIVPVYDPTVLEQFKNTRVLGTSIVDESMSVVDAGTADVTPYLECQPTVKLSKIMTQAYDRLFGVEVEQLILTEQSSPDITTTVEDTRGMFVAERPATLKPTDNMVKLLGGTEFVEEALIMYRASNGTLQSRKITSIWCEPYGSDLGSMGTMAPMFFQKICCQYRPIEFLLEEGQNDGDTPIVHGVFNNVDNYATISGTALLNVHRTCVLSMMSLPMSQNVIGQ